MGEQRMESHTDDALPIVSLRCGSETLRFAVAKGAPGALVLRGEPPALTGLLEFTIAASWLPARAVRGIGMLARIGAPGSGLFALRLARLSSGTGIMPLKETLRTLCGWDTHNSALPPLQRLGHYWWVELSPEGSLQMQPKYTPADITAWMGRWHAESALSPTNVYLRLPITYLVSNIPHTGRAVRLDTSTLIVHTNALLPPLGASVAVQFTLDCGLLDRHAILRGAVARRADAQNQWKGRFDLKIHDVEDIEYPGVFHSVLEQAAKAHEEPYITVPDPFASN